MNMYSMAIREHFRNAEKMQHMMVFFFSSLNDFASRTRSLFSSDKTLMMSVNTSVDYGNEQYKSNPNYLLIKHSICNKFLFIMAFLSNFI